MLGPEDDPGPTGRSLLRAAPLDTRATLPPPSAFVSVPGGGGRRAAAVVEEHDRGQSLGSSAGSMGGESRPAAANGPLTSHSGGVPAGSDTILTAIHGPTDA